MRNVKARALCIAAPGMALLCGASALAEEAVARPALEEVVVTAQKRTESIQDVPIAIAAFDGRQMESFGINNAVQISQMVPNFSVGTLGGGSSPITFLNIRGIQTTDFTLINDASVALYVDEVYQSAQAAGISQVYDMERVEVLKGPQGTLFGRNASAGLLHYITKRPTDEFEAYAELQLGDHGRKIAQGAISGPLADGVNARLAGKYNSDDGYAENADGVDGFGETDIYALRASVEFDLGENAQALVSIHHSNSDGTANPRYQVGTRDSESGAPCAPVDVQKGRCVSGTGFRFPSADAERTYDAEPLISEYDATGGVINISWDLDWGTFTSITGYEEFESAVTGDTGTGAPYSNLIIQVPFTAEAENFSQEFRINGETDSLRWLAGLYYYEDERTGANTVDLIPLGVRLTDESATTESTSYAIFGSADYSFSDSLSLTAGLRFTDEVRELIQNINNLTGVDTPADDAEDQEVTGDASLQWRPNDDHMLYLKFSRGFKNGGFNIDPVSVGPVDSEILDSWELGAKSAWLDNRLQSSVAIFHYDFQGFQSVATTLDPDTLAPTADFINAGDASVQGVEVDIRWLALENLELYFSAAYLDTEIDADPELVIDGNNVDGNELQQAPSYQFAGYAKYFIDTDSSGRFTLQTDFWYKEPTFFGLDNSPAETSDYNDVVNARIRWDSPSSRYHLSVFVDNVFDEQYTTHSFYSPASDAAWYDQGLPRWWGVKMGASF